MINHSYYKTKKQKVAQLIFDVLTQKKDVKTALKSFPTPDKDYSLKVAWHALVHYEADEDLRKNDCEYAIAQDEYLTFVAEQLSLNNELPDNIIKEYIDIYDDTLISKKRSWKNLWGLFDKSLNI